MNATTKASQANEAKNEAKKVLVVGSFVMDLIVQTERFPERGETVLGTNYNTAPGGKGANQAVQMGRLGLDVAMLGKVGNDDFGKRLLTSMREAGVDCSGVKEDGSFSAIGNVQIEQRPDGSTENRIIVVPGANMEITEEDLTGLAETIGDYDLVVQQQEIPLEINRYVRRLAREAGVPVLLNPAPSYALEEEDYPEIRYLVPNEHELSALTGMSVSGEDGLDLEKVEEAARLLQSRGTREVIVTLGKYGAAWLKEDGMVLVPTLKDVPVVDPTAAGDSFIGALSLCILRGLKPRDALDFANHVASLTVSKLGAQTSLPTLEEVRAFIQERGEAPVE